MTQSLKNRTPIIQNNPPSEGSVICATARSMKQHDNAKIHSPTLSLIILMSWKINNKIYLVRVIHICQSFQIQLVNSCQKQQTVRKKEREYILSICMYHTNNFYGKQLQKFVTNTLLFRNQLNTTNFRNSHNNSQLTSHFHN